MSGRARGADFSAYQSIEHVHELAKTLDFGIVKATEGTSYVSPQLHGQITELRKVQAVVGVYHFLTGEDGVRQWDHFEAVIRPLGVYVVACDHEPENGVCPPDHVAAAFIRRGRQRGYKVGRYGSSGVTMNRTLGEAWRWVAQYSPTAPRIRWDVWQFSDGHGSQDWNVFRGDRAQLDRFVASLKPKPKPPAARWWIRDMAVGRSLGPYRLIQVGPAIAAYMLRHAAATAYTVERK